MCALNCPEVLTLQLPEDPALIPSFLEHVWAFDSAGLTSEDQQRTRMYQQNAERERFRKTTLSLKDFIQSLDLHVTVDVMKPHQLGRVSQLTQRTNQFNCTSLRRSEGEILGFLEKRDAKCLTVRVSDRFGDYGLAGVAILEPRGDRFTLDTLLLSCRVLGRGVEHELLRQIGTRALQEGKELVEIPYVPTKRNLPAWEFLQKVGAQYGNQENTLWTFPAEYLAALQYSPDEIATVTREAPLPKTECISSSSAQLWSLDASIAQRIGETLFNVEKITRAIEEHHSGTGTLRAPARPLAHANTEEAILLQIWRRVLGRQQVGMHDNFFEAGGTSLKAVQVVAAIKKELKQSLSIVSLFECPTISLLAGEIEAGFRRSSTGRHKCR